MSPAAVTRDTVVQVADLRVTFCPPTGEVEAVKGIDLSLQRGRVLGVVGESGSGKSASFRALLGLTPSSARVTGTVTHSPSAATSVEQATARLRASTAMIYQNPGAALNPVFTIGKQLALAAGSEDRGLLADLLDQVGLANPERALDAYPHEFSGGMKQRAVIAMALAKRPEILVADEPTTALDVTTQDRVLDLLLDLRERHELSIVFVSHDLGVIERVADDVVVMRHGQVVESGPAAEVLGDPQHDYTKALIAARPSETNERATASETPLLTIKGLTVDYRSREARGATVRVIDDLDLHVRTGETLALVGESGSGKSTLANAVVGLLPVTGSIRYGDSELVGLTGRARRPMQRELQIVFQNPLMSFNPRHRVGRQLDEPMRIHLPVDGQTRRERIENVLKDLELDAGLLDRFPHELSGGQAQRMVLARALLLEPKLVVFDEPTSALDVSVQAAVLDLLARLKAEYQLTYLFITHDLGVARHIADRIAVMRQGEIVELAPTAELFDAPQHDYTRELLEAARC